jgi:hypothetical protein
MDTVRIVPKQNALPRHGLEWLILAGIVTVVLWQIPSADLILYPFAILATWFHELAHGLAALATGGSFNELILYSDGSGIAHYSYLTGGFDHLSQAFIAAAGPLGPPLAGALFIIAGRNTKGTNIALLALAATLILSALLWIRTPFGLIASGTFALLIALVAIKSGATLRAFTIQFLGVQACVSTYKQVDYLFMGQAEIGGQIMYSDTMQIQQQLLLPYWFWGALIILLSLAMLLGALWFAYRDVGRQGRRTGYRRG